MKTVDVSESVMRRVVRFERNRIIRWIGVFVTVLGILAGLTVFAIWLSARRVLEMQSLELLELFREDPEIIREFWRDTLAVFWEELPVDVIVAGILSIIAIVVLWFVTRRKRGVLRTKIKQLAKVR